MSFKTVQIELLDGSEYSISILKSTKANKILESIFEKLNLIEKDYFGIYLYDMNTDKKLWLKNNNRVWSQIVKLTDPPYHLYFGVRYYPSDFALLEEDITIYMVYLQLRREVLNGRVICSEDERSTMLAYILQAEGGDFNGETKYFNFFENILGNSTYMQQNVIKIYKGLKGINAPTSEMKFLDIALQKAYYNQEIYPVQYDAQPTLRDLLLSLGPLGIGVYQNNVKVEIFRWIEVWNIGWINKTLWFRIIRDNQKNKHKYHFNDSKSCEKVWKAFRDYFQFHTVERKIDSNILFGRIPPKVYRIHLLNEQSTPSQRNMSTKPKISQENISGLIHDRTMGNPLLNEHFGVNSEKISLYNPDETLRGNNNKTKKNFLKTFSSPAQVINSTEQYKVRRGNNESSTSKF
ncbi:FERM domain-containing protein 5-like isoform X1 [Hydra vulgaris]|uniref:FERM domain-containing protein 5-like isoform X1 n=2 Tax=Hydra vulgaris TaxID=6087 RepID=A0ABM4BW64_HYDVU